MKFKYLLIALFLTLTTPSCNSNDEGVLEDDNALAGTLWEGQTNNSILINFISNTKVTIEVSGNVDDGELEYVFNGNIGTIIFPEDNNTEPNFEVSGSVLTLLDNWILGTQNTFIKR